MHILPKNSYNCFCPCFFQIFDYEDNTQPSFHDDSDTDDDESSMQGDYGESSEDEVQVPAKVPNSDLEWDHSNLGI